MTTQAETDIGYYDAREQSGELELEADVCVIGSGAGGAVLAAGLAELGRDVVIIEEGDRFTKERGSFQGSPLDRFQRMYPQPDLWRAWPWSAKVPGIEESSRGLRVVRRRIEGP